MRIQPAIRAKTPRPHQEEAITAAIRGFRGRDRGKVLMACGTGKTLVGQRVSEELNARLNVVFVPTLNLLGQTISNWAENSKRELRVLAVCSDETVTDDDLLISHADDIKAPVTTDPKVIADFLKSDEPSVVFCTYVSSERLAEAQVLGAPSFDLGIADEAHNVAGLELSSKTNPVDEQLVSIDKRLFMTATPRVYTTEAKARNPETIVYSMDDERHFGKTFYELSFGEAIKRDLLSNYRVVVIGMTEKDLVRSGVATKITQSDLRMSRTEALGYMGLAKIAEQFDLRRVITFHNRISKAATFAQRFPEVASLVNNGTTNSTINAAFVSGDMSAHERNVQLEALRTIEPDERHFLANVKVLSEGVDVPTLDGIAFLDPRTSVADIMQAVGRAIRKNDVTSIGTIVIPVFISDKDDPNMALDNGTFKLAWNVIRALRSHDKTLGDELDQIRLFNPSGGSFTSLPDRIIIDLPDGIDPSMQQSIYARLVEATTSSFLDGVRHLREHYLETGNPNPPVRYKSPDGFPTGKWLAHHLGWARKPGYPPERKRLIEEAAPGISWNPLNDHLMNGLEHLAIFYKETGNPNPPVKYKSRDGFPLGMWLSNQRYQAMKPGYPPKQKALIEQVAPGILWHQVYDKNFENGVKHLETFYKETGNPNPPQKYKSPDGFPLGQWLARQRKAAQKTGYPPERKARIEAVAPGISWNPLDDGFINAINHLNAFYKETGNPNPPQKYKSPDGFPLGQWWTNTITRANKSGYPAERRALIEQVAPGISWNLRNEKMDDALMKDVEHLDAFYKKTGKSNPPKNYESPGDGYPLGKRIKSMREQARKPGYPPERKALIEEVAPEFNWNPGKKLKDPGKELDL